jgi:hypothetical protein
MSGNRGQGASLVNRWAGLLLQGIITVHGLDGHEVGVNVRAITTIGDPGKTMNTSANCQVNLAGNVKFVTTKESCTQVLRMVDEVYERDAAAASPTGGYLDGR